MGETGTAILLFGNNVREEARAAYESWHSSHHVPQRLTVPGILGAIRFRLAGPGGPEYLTLYRLRDARVLDSPEYRALLEHPDPPTLAMRPNLLAPHRYVARTALVPALPDWFAMRAEHARWPFGTIEPPEQLMITGPLVADQRNHPIMGAEPLPEGYLRLRFSRAERLEPPEDEASAIGGLYRSLDRFGFDAR